MLPSATTWMLSTTCLLHVCYHGKSKSVLTCLALCCTFRLPKGMVPDLPKAPRAPQVPQGIPRGAPTGSPYISSRGPQKPLLELQGVPRNPSVSSMGALGAPGAPRSPYNPLHELQGVAGAHGSPYRGSMEPLGGPRGSLELWIPGDPWGRCPWSSCTGS